MTHFKNSILTLTTFMMLGTFCNTSCATDEASPKTLKRRSSLENLIKMNYTPEYIDACVKHLPTQMPNYQKLQSCLHNFCVKLVQEKNYNYQFSTALNILSATLTSIIWDSLNPLEKDKVLGSKYILPCINAGFFANAVELNYAKIEIVNTHLISLCAQEEASGFSLKNVRVLSETLKILMNIMNRYGELSENPELPSNGDSPISASSAAKVHD